MDHLFYLTGVRTHSFPIFINNWAGLYPIPLWEQYEKALQKSVLEEADLHALFTFYWRNKWTKKKREVFQIIAEKVDFLTELKQSEHVFARIQLHFDKLPTDIQLFLLHIVKAKQFPIWTAEAMAALGFILHKNPDFFKRKQKAKTYFDVYLPFVEQELYEIPFHKIHQAFYAFGKFLLETSIQHQKIMRF